MLRQSAESDRRSSRISRSITLVVVIIAAIAAAGLRPSPNTSANAAEEKPPAHERDAIPPVSSATDPLPAVETVPQEPADATHVATAMIRMSRQPASVVAQGGDAPSDAAWQVYAMTHKALLTSHFVLRAALRDPEVAALPLVRGQDDPISWLQGRLRIELIPNTEILLVQMKGPADEMQQAMKMVDAVVDAFFKEVVYEERQRQLVTRDSLARSLARLKDELLGKMEEFYGIARDLGAVVEGSGRTSQQLDLNRLDRVEDELMRLEEAQLRDAIHQKLGVEATPEQKAQRNFYDQRIAQLNKRRDELENVIRSQSAESVDLISRQREIERLERIADEMALRLEMIDVESAAPDRVQLIQPAVVTTL